MTSATLTPMSSVKNDDRGAIMVIGIFMACAMIGLMWYMIGLGDALIWRDRSQEATDSMAFSSAAIHAHGMNIIAFINIVMSILAAIYLLAAIVYNILDFLLTFTGRTDDHCHVYQKLPRVGIPPWENVSSCQVRDKIKKAVEIVLAFFTGGATAEDVNNDEFCWAAAALQPVHDYLADDLGKCAPKGGGNPGHAIKNYEDNILGPVNFWGAKLQTKIAQLAPWVGAAMGSYVGYEYTDHTDNVRDRHRYGTALSPGMMSPDDVNGYTVSEAQRTKNWLKPQGDPRIGMPVGALEMGYLCYRDGKYAFGWLENAIPFLKGVPFLDKVLNWVADKIATKVEAWYCANDSHGIPALKSLSEKFSMLSQLTIIFSNPRFDLKMRDAPYAFNHGADPFWNSEKTGGPKVMVEYAENGNDWMQVFALTLPLNREEDNDSEHRVGFTQGKGGGKGVSYKESHNSRDLYTEGKNAYYSTAEFYLNKDKEWTHFEVNDTPAHNLNNATFSMKWRARLRRVHSPAWGDEMLNWIQKKTGIPTGIFNNARLIKARDWIHNYLLDDPQAKYTTAYKALQDGNKHKAKSYLEASSLVPDAFH